MRYASALAIAVAAIFMMSALPFVANSVSDAADPTPDIYVDTSSNLAISGYISGYDTSSTTPRAYLFVVHKEIVDGKDVYQYTNLNPLQTDNPLISAQVDANNKFSVLIPRIINSDVEYYLSFGMYSIKSLPWTEDDEGVTIVPDDTCPSKTGSYYAYKIPHSDPWSDTTKYPTYNESSPDTTQVWITSSTNTGKGLISIDRAMGTVTGHVSIVVRGSQSNLEDVRVELYSEGKQVAYTNTDSHGDYSLEVSTGTYELKFSRGNYTHAPVPVEVKEGINNVPEVTMELEMDNSYFGYDLVHFLMFIGAGICVLIIILSIGFQYKRMKMNKSGREWILDDMPEEDDD